MTGCREVRDWLGAYRDAELGLRARHRVERHLAACGRCREELAQLASIGRAVREAEAALPAPGSAEIWAGIGPRLAAVDAERAREPRPAREAAAPALGLRRRRRALPWLAAPVGALAVALATALLLFSGTGVEAPRRSMVRSLDAHGSPVMLIEDEKGTIIWLIDPEGDEMSRTRSSWSVLL